MTSSALPLLRRPWRESSSVSRYQRRARTLPVKPSKQAIPTNPKVPYLPRYLPRPGRNLFSRAFPLHPSSAPLLPHKPSSSILFRHLLAINQIRPLHFRLHRTIGTPHSSVLHLPPVFRLPSSSSQVVYSMLISSLLYTALLRVANVCEASL